MTRHSTLIAAGALVMALAAGSPALAGQERGARRGQERGGRQAQGHAQPRDDHRSDDRGSSHGESYDRGRDDTRRGPVVVVPVRPPAVYHRGYGNGNYGAYRYAPRAIVPYRAPRHYYGPGGNFSVYFSLGSGYRYGSPYSGRVYGYAPPLGYGARRDYGDVRLQIRPRGAAVYVDGYYAGIVDDFDGIFQRLTLTVGPHQIEVEAPGLQPQAFDVYVDPSRTVDVHADLFPYQP